MSLEFISSTPNSGEAQDLTFSSANALESCRIRPSAHVAVDTRDIDTSAADVATTAPIDRVDYAVDSEFWLRVTTMSIHRDVNEIFPASQRVPAAVAEQCQALAAHLFVTRLRFTAFEGTQ